MGCITNSKTSKPDKKEKDVQIDTNLYSRQIGTFGLETMGKLIKMNVCIIGLRGTGVEVAKNLILAGPKSVYIYDPEITSLRDLGSNFYLSQEHVGKVSRAQASITRLQELNDYVKVSVVETREELDKLMQEGQLSVVCQTEMIINNQVLDPKDINN